MSNEQKRKHTPGVCEVGVDPFRDESDCNCLPPLEQRLVEVELAEEGTPLAKFQKDRTDAISRMFDRDKCETLHTTTKFFAELDESVRSAFSQIRQDERERCVEVGEKIRITKDSHPFHANFDAIKDHVTGYNQAITDYQKLLNQE